MDSSHDEPSIRRLRYRFVTTCSTSLPLAGRLLNTLRAAKGHDFFLRGRNLEGVSCVVRVDTLPERSRRRAAGLEGSEVMTDIERQKLLMIATTVIFAVIWAITNLA